ncbi:MAG: glycosyltransferase family 2 protein [Christensenellales bacterium]
MLFKKCIESIQQSDYTNFEILMIDDGSTDGTAELCDALAIEDPRICVIHQNNHGISASRNTELNHAKGKYIAFFDADDLIDSKMFSSLVPLIESGAELAACQPFVCSRRNQLSETS